MAGHCTKNVPNAASWLDAATSTRCLQLSPKPGDIYVHDISPWIKIDSPDFLQQLAS
jgi:hypothetical protein